MSDDLVKRLRDWQHVHPEDQDKPEGHLYEEAADRIEALETVLNKLEYWFDTDQEILNAMTPDERTDHMRQLNLIRDTLSDCA